MKSMPWTYTIHWNYNGCEWFKKGRMFLSSPRVFCYLLICAIKRRINGITDTSACFLCIDSVNQKPLRYNDIRFLFK